MYYYDTNDNTGKKIGVAAVLAYLAVWAVLFLVVSFTFDVREAGEGILINFGDTEQASGFELPDGGASASSQPQAPQTPGELLTQDHEEAPALRPASERQREQPVRTDRENPATQQPVAQTQQPQRTANPALNMPAVNPGRSASEGTAATGTGNQGSPDGSDTGSHDGTGQGGSGVGFDLAGRRNLSLPVPVYNAGDEGTVVVEVIVRADGKVRTARRVSNNRDPNSPNKRVVSTTTNDARLVKAAEQAAANSSFNSISGDGEQRGWIIYNFNVK